MANHNIRDVYRNKGTPVVLTSEALHSGQFGIYRMNTQNPTKLLTGSMAAAGLESPDAEFADCLGCFHRIVPSLLGADDRPNLPTRSLRLTLDYLQELVDL